jgi:transcription termination factor Rho
VTDTSQIAPADSAAGGGPRTGSLSALRLPELQAVAAQLGISGTGRMRKSDLIEAIKARESGGGAAPAADTAPAGSAPSNGASTTSSSSSTSASMPAPTPAPRARGRRAGAPAGPPAPRAGENGTGEAPPQQTLPIEEGAGQSARVETVSGEGAPASAAATPAEDAAEPAAETPAPREARRERRPREGQRDQQARDGQRDGQRDQQVRDGQRDGQQVRDGQRDGQRDQQVRDGQRDGQRDQQARDGQRDQQARDGQRDQQARDGQRDGQQPSQRQSFADDDDEDGDGRGRRRRGRYRDRKRRGRDGEPTRNGVVTDEPEVGEDDVLVPVAGILDVLENYAFVRTSGYLPGPNDVYVSLGQVKRYGLRKGDAVVGAVRAQRDGEQSQGRQQKFNALVRIDTVNGSSPDDARGRPEFGKLTPLYPQERLRLETEPNQVSNRLIDLVAPIGKGQRGLIVSPPKAGKTLILQAIANAITRNNPECHLMVVLVDERPEEVTDMQRTVKGEVIASTFDRPADDHTTVAELAIERAKRLVELGHDVVVLLDSITRLGRAYNLAAPASGRILSGGVDSSALYPPKRFFGAARNIENGGSLTILATALVETGSKMDEVIFEEFKGTGNMELRLSRQLADKRIFPAIDVNASGTRREEILMSKEELNIVWKLRRVMGALEPQQAIELLLDRVKQTRSNIEFLMQVQKSTPVPGRGDDD